MSNLLECCRLNGDTGIAGPGPLHRPVDRRAGDREQFLQFADRVIAPVVQGKEVGLLLGAELGLLASQPALGPGDLHTVAR
jgi:hypothetical protein